MGKKVTAYLRLNHYQLFWVMSSVIVAVLPHIARMPMWFIPMLVAAVGYRTFSQYKKITRTFNAILLLITVLTIALIFYSQGVGFSREISVNILISMTVLKLLETYRLRDAYLIVILCYFVVMTRFLYTQDLFLLFYLLLSVFVTTHTLRMIHKTTHQYYFGRQELRFTVKILASSIPFTLVFFLLFPRLGSPIWGSPDVFGEGKTGISDSMSPGSISQLFADDSPAFRVTFKNMTPATNQMYWRGPVLWHFDGLTWSKQSHTSLRSGGGELQGRRIKYDVELESTGQNYLFALDYVNHVNSNAFLLPDSTVYTPQKVNQMRHYSAESILTDQYEERLSDYHKKLLLKLPAESNPETRKMINSWLKETPGQADILSRTLNLFSEEPFYYSFNPPLLNGDTVDQFLFSTKEGFCEHYASAFVVMMRMAGIPARVVTGYQGGMNNGEYYLIRQSDAHAWAEVYLHNNKWLRVDPTAMVSPERVQQGASALLHERRSWFDYEWLRDIRANYDTLKFRWNQWIRSYDHKSQASFFSLIGFGQIEGEKIIFIMLLVMFLSVLVTVFMVRLLSLKKNNPYQKILKRYRIIFKELPEANSVSVSAEKLSTVVVFHYPSLRKNIENFTEKYTQYRYGLAKNRSKNEINELVTLLKKVKLAKEELTKKKKFL